MGFLQLLMQEGQETAVTAAQRLTLLDFAIKGGWVMIPIFLLFLIATYIFH
jgi:hypothetical protein